MFFAFVYLAVSLLGRKFEVDPDSGKTTAIAFCDMDINDHMEALYFSLSTMTTIGYGVSDYYFGGCWTPLLLVLWQVCSAICFDAVAVGLLFQKLSRGSKRAKTILFSDKAVVQRIRGVPHFMFRFGELRNRYHLMQASVRVYCIRHERLPVQPQNQVTRREIQNRPYLQHEASGTSQLSSPPSRSAIEIQTTHFVTRQVKLLHPDEASGSHILMSLPQVAVHRMDATSPLVPPRPIWYNAEGTPQFYDAAKGSTSDAASALTVTNDQTAQCPTDADMVESLEAEFDAIQHFLWDRDVEIVVLVEGTDEGTGAPTQARHSYKLDDVAWSHTFTPCVFPRHLDVNDGLISSNDEGSSADEDGNEGSRRSQSLDRRSRGSWTQTATHQSSTHMLQSGNRQRRQQDRRNGPILTIDFAHFHDIEPTPMDCDACPYVPDSMDTIP